MAVTIGDVTIRIGASTKTLNSDLRKAERSLQASAAKFKNLGQSLSLGVTAPLALAGAAAFKMASDFDESLNKVRVAFGDSALEIEAFAKKTLEASGIAEGSALDMAAYFGDMATSMGITQGAAADMAQQLVMLAGDLASFKNIDVKQAQTALAGVFTGETESLKQLGIVMTETNLAAFALTQGITKNIKTMSQSEKTNLRFAYVLNSTKNAQGDFARTSDGAANQMRIFQESVKQLSAQFGKKLLPLLTPLINRLNRLVERFSNLSEGSKSLIVTLAAVAAALGPILYGVGLLINAYTAAIIPIVRLTAGFAAQRIAAEKAGQAALTAGQYAAASFRTALAAAGPYLIAIGAIAFAAYQLYQNLQTSNKEKQKAKSLDEIAIENTQKERDKIQSLIGVIKSETAEKNTKKKALEEIKKLAPGYFADLDTEKISIDKLNVAYAEYSKNIIANAKALAGRQKVNEIAAELLDLENKLLQAEQTKNNAKAEGVKLAALGATPDQVAKQEETSIKLSNTLIETYKSRIGELEKQLVLYSEFSKVDGDLIKGDPDGSTEDLTKQLQALDVELVKITRLYNAGLIDSQEQASRTTDVLRKKLELLITSGFDPASKSVIELQKQIRSIGAGGPLDILPTGAVDPFKPLKDSIDGTLADIRKNTQKELGQALQGKVKFQGTSYDAWFKDFREQLDLIDIRQERGFITTGESDAQKIEFLTTSLKNLQDQGFSPLSPQILAIEAQLESLGISITDNLLTKLETGQQVVQAFASNLTTLIGDAFTTVGETIGAAFSGETNIATFFNRILSSVADFAKSFGKQLIAIGIAKLSLENLFKAGPVGAAAAIAAGTALIAISSAIQSNLAKNLPSLAIGTDYVKEDGLAMLHKGEAVVPADVVGGGFSRGGMVNVSGRIQGTDILLVSDYAMDFKTRIR